MSETDKKYTLIYVLVILAIISYANFWGLAIYEEIHSSKPVFLCNPHYFGAKWAYPNVCPDSFINATGNYCEGVLVCQNQVE